MPAVVAFRLLKAPSSTICKDAVLRTKLKLSGALAALAVPSLRYCVGVRLGSLVSPPDAVRKYPTFIWFPSIE